MIEFALSIIAFCFIVCVIGFIIFVPIVFITGTIKGVMEDHRKWKESKRLSNL